MALEQLRQLGKQGADHVLDADIENYFGSIEQADPTRVGFFGSAADKRLSLDVSWLESSDLRRFFKNFGGPLIQTLPCCLRCDQCCTVHLRRDAQHKFP